MAARQKRRIVLARIADLAQLRIAIATARAAATRVVRSQRCCARRLRRRGYLCGRCDRGRSCLCRRCGSLRGQRLGAGCIAAGGGLLLGQSLRFGGLPMDLLHVLRSLDQQQILTVAEPERMLLPRHVVLVPVAQTAAAAEALDAITLQRVEEAGVAERLRFLAHRFRPVVEGAQARRLDGELRMIGIADGRRRLHGNRDGLVLVLQRMLLLELVLLVQELVRRTVRHIHVQCGRTDVVQSDLYAARTSSSRSGRGTDARRCRVDGHRDTNGAGAHRWVHIERALADGVVAHIDAARAAHIDGDGRQDSVQGGRIDGHVVGAAPAQQRTVLRPALVLGDLVIVGFPATDLHLAEEALDIVIGPDKVEARLRQQIGIEEGVRPGRRERDATRLLRVELLRLRLRLLLLLLRLNVHGGTVIGFRVAAAAAAAAVMFGCRCDDR